MHFIIYDGEFTCDLEKGQHPEYVQIGAVKLDMALNEVDSFQSLIKPKDHPVAGERLFNMTGIVQADLDGADSFPEVVKRFKAWAGPEAYLITWGTYDLYVMRRDLKNNEMLDNWINDHHNIQKNLGKAIRPESKDKQIALTAALAHIGIEREYLHGALRDARYCAEMFRWGIKERHILINNRMFRKEVYKSLGLY